MCVHVYVCACVRDACVRRACVHAWVYMGTKGLSVRVRARARARVRKHMRALWVGGLSE